MTAAAVHDGGSGDSGSGGGGRGGAGDDNTEASGVVVAEALVP